MASVADPERQSSIKRYIGASWSWGRDALVRQNVGQTNARSKTFTRTSSGWGAGRSSSMRLFTSGPP